MINEAVFRNMSYGVYIISTMDGERPTGCVANSVMQITASSATVAVSMNHDNYTNQCMDQSGVFAFSILGEQTEVGTIGTFGFRSGKEINKFENVAYEMKAGAPVLKQSCGYVVCKIIDRMESPTHTVFLGEVIDSGMMEGSGQPMTYRYYHEVFKLKSPKNAPTYLQEKTEKDSL